MKTDEHGNRWNPKKNKAHRRKRPTRWPGTVIKMTMVEEEVKDEKGNPTFRVNGQKRMRRVRKYVVV